MKVIQLSEQSAPWYSDELVDALSAKRSVLSKPLGKILWVASMKNKQTKKKIVVPRR